MNSLAFNSDSLSASAPSAGLWSRAANLYWTGWTQYVASLNQDVGFRPQFPAWSRQVEAFTNGAPARIEAPAAGAGNRLVDRAA